MYEVRVVKWELFIYILFDIEMHCRSIVGGYSVDPAYIIHTVANLFQDFRPGVCSPGNARMGSEGEAF